MKLDKRIIEGKRPLDCLDVDIAKTYIGQKGYFAICLCAFQDLKSIDYHLTYATLKEVNSQKTMAFADDFDGDEFSYFLPEEWVQKEKPEPKYIHHAEIIEAFAHTDGDVFVGIGNAVKALSGWFQTIEVKDPETGAWVPFGVEE